MIGTILYIAVITFAAVWYYSTEPWLSGFSAGVSYCLVFHAIGTYLVKRRGA